MTAPGVPPASHVASQWPANEQPFTLFDVSGFPLVRPRTQGKPSGYGPTWTQEMDALLSGGRPFVLLVDEPQAQESPQDRKTKTLWLKANKAALASLCRGFVMVEPDAVKRLALKIQGVALAKAFGLVFQAVADIEEANAAASILISADPAGDAAGS